MFFYTGSMIAPELQTADPSVRLIEPDVERDAPLSFEWMAGDEGRRSQALMGVADKDIHAHTLDESELLIESFMDSDNEIVWMVEHEGKVVGALEVHLKETELLPGPSIHLMIGDVEVRGQGVGYAVLYAAIAYLRDEQGHDIIFTRVRTNNVPSLHLFLKLGFEEDGEPYVDNDDLSWQTMIYRSEV